MDEDELLYWLCMLGLSMATAGAWLWLGIGAGLFVLGVGFYVMALTIKCGVARGAYMIEAARRMKG